MTRFARWTLGSLSVVGILVALVCALLFALLGTERGGRWALANVLPLVAEEARLGRFAGTLTRGITLEDLYLPLDAAHIHIDRVEGVWNLWNLLGGQFPIERLAVSGLDIALQEQAPEPEPEEPPGPWPSIALPFTVSLEDGRVNDLRIITGDTEHHIQQIVLTGSGGILHTRIQQLAAVMDEHHIVLAGRIANRAPYDLDLTVDWSLQLPDGLHIAGQGKLGGNLASLTLEHHLSAPVELFTALQAELPFDPAIASIDPKAISLHLHSQWRDLEPPPGTGLPALASDGELDIEGGWANYRFRLDTSLAFDPAAVENGTTAEPPSPLPPELLHALAAGPVELALSGSGSELAVQLERLLLDSPLGRVDANGDFNAAEPISWSLDLALHDIDSAPLVPDWPAKITSRLQTQGHWQQDDYRIALEIAELHGHVREAILSGNGNINLTPGRQHIDQLSLHLGDNRLAIDGQLGLQGGASRAANGSLALTWQLLADELAQIHPDLKGSIRSDGRLTGTLAAPSGSAHLEARAIQFGEIAVSQVDLEVAAPDHDNLSLDLSVTGIDAAPLENATLTAALTGALSRHRFNVELRDSGDNHLALTLTGGLLEQQWRGQLSDLQIDNPLAGSWRQADTTALTLSAEAVALETLCLGQEATRLCTKASWRDQQLSAEGSLDALPLARFATTLPPELALLGEISSHFRAAGPPDNLSGEIRLATKGLLLRHQPADDGDPVEYPAQIDFDGVLANGGANATLALDLEGIGNLNAELKASALSAEGELQGTAQGNFDNLAWLDALLPQIDNMEGRVALALALSGTVGQPELNGNIDINDVAAEIPLAGIALHDGDITIALDDLGQWQLHGLVSSGDGSLHLDGNGLLNAEQGVGGTVTLQGENFTLANRPDARVVVSPNLRLALTSDLLQLRGDLAVNDGEIILATLPEQAVSVSPDERLLQDDGDKPPSRALDVRMQLTIDERFSLRGFGLRTRLGGNLQLIQRGEDPPRANGSLTLYDGVYQAYGQSLAVERGVLIFQGQVDNPGLNIRAVRKVPGYTVGIDIGGVAQDIRSELFSTPPLPPTDTIAILITGKAPSQMSESDANQVINAAAALGISQSEGITNNLKNAFGLDVVDLQGGDDYLDSSLVVGKYLTPELFISYVQNLFTPTGSVVLDYALTRNLGLKASSGETQSIDFLYRIEHGGLD
ncbi:MAG: translocation/assembly module TamB domain-containing protein [Porticoccaceae bacterium]|nr:translocation/assembly module TamB domain-containing protein [Porticoccaceae bacterium]